MIEKAVDLGVRDCIKMIRLKWERLLDLTPEMAKMKRFNKAIFRSTTDVRLRYFQYKIVNRILFLNKQLSKMKIVNSEKNFFLW